MLLVDLLHVSAAAAAPYKTFVLNLLQLFVGTHMHLCVTVGNVSRKTGYVMECQIATEVKMKKIVTHLVGIVYNIFQSSFRLS